MAAPLSSWPWEFMGNSKWVLYAAFLVKAIYSMYKEETSIKDNWSLHIFAICIVRLFLYQLWTSFANMLYLTRNRRIVKKGVDFEQIDEEWDWDNFILLQAIITAMSFSMFTSFESIQIWEKRGIVSAIALHVAISEPLFYYIHKCFHQNYLFRNYHSIHHSSPVPQAYTAGHGTFLEYLLLTAVAGIPIVATFLIGYGSQTLIYGHVLVFDLLRCLGHCNLEIVPYQIFEAVPFFRYLIYTPTYHSLHRAEMGTNYCLFMPLFDALGNTLNPKSWEMHKRNCLDSSKHGRAPDFVFLAHPVDLSSAMHAPFLARSVASMPYYTRIYLLPLLPVSFISMVLMWAKSKTFLVSSYTLRDMMQHTWSVPRFGFQYFLPFAKEGINKQIEDAILKANRLGVKVISLAALNKNEALNGGGTLFVDKHPNLNVRVVHGNTLTAAVTLHEIPEDVDEVFLTGATSKLGRSIALYLCRKRVRVLMLTSSTERFRKIQREASPDCQKYLVHVTKYLAAQNCKTWIVGKWITPRQQNFAPKGAHFHQFVVPPILQFRRDCTYGDLAAMKLPEDAYGLGSCEYTMDRGVVHACHAGGVVHTLEGWTHHEVGAIDVDRLDIVWEAALKHGFRPLSNN